MINLDRKRIITAHRIGAIVELPAIYIEKAIVRRWGRGDETDPAVQTSCCVFLFNFLSNDAMLTNDTDWYNIVSYMLTAKTVEPKVWQKQLYKMIMSVSQQ